MIVLLIKQPTLLLPIIPAINLRIKNSKNIIFSYIIINSIRNKFDNLCDLISKNVDILSVAETKLEPELNLRKEKWLFMRRYEPPLQNNNYFLDTFGI